MSKALILIIGLMVLLAGFGYVLLAYEVAKGFVIVGIGLGMVWAGNRLKT